MTAIPSCPVLVVEDDESFRKGLVQALDANHFKVTPVADRDAAITALESDPYQIIILDLALAASDGLDVLSYIRENRERLDGKVLIVTGADAQVREKIDMKLAEEVLLKPVDFHYIAARARKYCGH